jgi:hypothetical protein
MSCPDTSIVKTLDPHSQSEYVPEYLSLSNPTKLIVIISFKLQHYARIEESTASYAPIPGKEKLDAPTSLPTTP